MCGNISYYFMQVSYLSLMFLLLYKKHTCLLVVLLLPLVVGRIMNE